MRYKFFLKKNAAKARNPLQRHISQPFNLTSPASHSALGNGVGNGMISAAK